MAKVVVMTGGTSGIGAVAAQRMLSEDVQLLLAARQGVLEDGLATVDLTKLDEVRAFAASVLHCLDNSTIDALVLNAGGYCRGRTQEGYDGIFVLNHLAHYLLIRLLWPHLSHGAMVLLTTSGTHDPAERYQVPPPRHANAPLLARPELDPEADSSPWTAAGRAYSSAKLCVMLTARALAARDDTRARSIQVLAYDPGPTPGTGLVREQGAFLRLLWGGLARPLRWFMRGANTIDAAGDALGSLALGAIEPPEGRLYAALRRGELCWPDPSQLAQRDDLMQALWQDSEQLVGLSGTGGLTHTGKAGNSPAG